MESLSNFLNSPFIVKSLLIVILLFVFATVIFFATLSTIAAFIRGLFGGYSKGDGSTSSVSSWPILLILGVSLYLLLLNGKGCQVEHKANAKYTDWSIKGDDEDVKINESPDPSLKAKKDAVKKDPKTARKPLEGRKNPLIHDRRPAPKHSDYRSGRRPTAYYLQVCSREAAMEVVTEKAIDRYGPIASEENLLLYLGWQDENPKIKVLMGPLESKAEAAQHRQWLLERSIKSFVVADYEVKYLKAI